MECQVHAMLFMQKYAMVKWPCLIFVLAGHNSTLPLTGEVISHGITSHQSEDKNALRPTLASRGINHHLKYRASQEHTDGKLSSVLHASVNSTMPLHEHDCEEYEREKQAVPKDNLATSVEDFYDKGTCMKPSIEVLPSHNHAASGDTANDTVPVANVLLEEVQNGLESENKLDMAKEDNVSLAREIGQEFHDIGLGGEECEEDILCQISRTCFAPSEQIFCKAPESTCESKCGDTTSSPNMSEQTVGGKAATHIKEGSGNWTHQLHTCNATEGTFGENTQDILRHQPERCRVWVLGLLGLGLVLVSPYLASSWVIAH